MDNNYNPNINQGGDYNKGDFNNQGQPMSTPLITNSTPPQGYNPPQQNYNPPPQQPIIVQQPMMIQNQTVPMDIAMMEAVLKSAPGFVTCPFCQHQGITNAKTACSFLSCLCCCCTGVLCWVIFQACRNKDINCTDADHFCMRCGNKLYSYQAC
jgi:hypothetical protein